MKKGLFLALIFFLSIFSIGMKGCSKDSFVTLSTDSGKHNFNVEVAESIAAKVEGLMFRESLPKENGMLFVYNSESNRSFWMQNTLIPLDMIFIDANLEVVDIKVNAQPCEDLICKTYPSAKPAQYVLELNGGVSEEIGLMVGDKIELNIIPN